MSHMTNKLKTMNMPLPDPFVVQLVFKDFSTSHVNYNTQPENRNVEKLYVEKLFTMCNQKRIYIEGHQWRGACLPCSVEKQELSEQ